MQELELLGEYLMKLRQEKLQMAHVRALNPESSLLEIRIPCYEAELCNRIREAVKVLASDPGKFIQEFLT
jgi:hypothetical protein